MKAICSKCGQVWNVSVHKNMKEPYECPHCFSRKKVKKIMLVTAGFFVSCLLSIKCSKIATVQRGYQVLVGGEDFIPLLYLAVVVFLKTISDYKKENAHK